MNYAVEVDSGAMIYIPSFIKMGLGMHKLIGGIYACARPDKRRKRERERKREERDISNCQGNNLNIA
jgi:hypothetical protein